jgi:hypothetical protein
METLTGFPNLPALWLRQAKPAYANAIRAMRVHARLGRRLASGCGQPERLLTSRRIPIPLRPHAELERVSERGDSRGSAQVGQTDTPCP